MSVTTKETGNQTVTKRKVTTPKITKPEVIPLGHDQLPPKTNRLGPDRERVRNAATKAAEQIIFPAPPWLIDVLVDQSFEVVHSHCMEEMWPKRQVMYETLQEIHQLLDRLDKHLRNAPVIAFIELKSRPGLPQLLAEIAGNHKELRSRIGHSPNSPELVDEKGKLRKGRGKPLLSHMVPKLVCAAIIAEVVDFFYPDIGSKPSQRRAWTAAEALWNAWIKSQKHWSNDPLTGWKDYFADIDDPGLKPLRSELRRVLEISAYQHAQTAEEK